MKLVELKSLCESSDISSRIDDVRGIEDDSKKLKALIDLVDSECQPFFREYGVSGLVEYAKSPSGRFFRGIRTASEQRLFYKRIRNDRQPLDTHISIQEEVDEYMSKRGAHALRSNSAFVTKNYVDAKGYGIPFVIVPVGSFHYTWVQGMIDLTLTTNNYIREKGFFPDNLDDYEERNEIIDDVVETLIEEYLESGLRIDQGIKQTKGEEVLIEASGLIYIHNKVIDYILENADET